MWINASSVSSLPWSGLLWIQSTLQKHTVQGRNPPWTAHWCIAGHHAEKKQCSLINKTAINCLKAALYDKLSQIIWLTEKRRNSHYELLKNIRIACQLLTIAVSHTQTVKSARIKIVQHFPASPYFSFSCSCKTNTRVPASYMVQTTFTK